MCAVCACWVLMLYMYLGLEGGATDTPSPVKSPVPSEVPSEAAGPSRLRPGVRQPSRSAGGDPELERLNRAGSEADRRRKLQGYERHAFNTLVSDRIGLRRSLPDTRHSG